MAVIKRIPVLIVAVVLTVGVVYGAGVWIFNTGIPVDYQNPITIEMSDEIQIEETGEEQWQTVKFRDTTERKNDANFSYNDPPHQFYTYVNLSNVAGSENITIRTEVEKPEDFGTEEMGFTVRGGIVEPGLIDEVDEWDSITNETTVEQGEERFLTVVYTLSDDIPDQPDDPVLWNFRDLS